VELAIGPNLVVTEVFPMALAGIKPNTFIGAGAMPQPEGTQKAIAVLLFPEAMRGTGEGHRPFDFLPQSTMTNATVAGAATAADGPRLRVTYPGGEQTLVWCRRRRRCSASSPARASCWRSGRGCH
jgi:hypothetical protein